jgi:hypothetical protein
MVQIIGDSDSLLKEVEIGLQELEKEYPKLRADAYRYNSASIRVRIVSPDFQKIDEFQREEQIWPRLKRLMSDEAWSEISMLLLLADPKEQPFLNMEFEKPSKSLL